MPNDSYKCYTWCEQKQASTCEIKNSPTLLYVQPDPKETLPALLVVNILLNTSHYSFLLFLICF